MGSAAVRASLSSEPGNVADLAKRYREVRGATLALCATLSPEDAQVQSMTEASPAKWHLAHTTWFFETLVLAPHVPGYEAFDPSFRVLFNSYYQSVGRQHPRPERGLLTRPGWSRVLDYRARIDEGIGALLERVPVDARVAELVELGLNHEQQHQELLLTDIKHLFSYNPLRPVFREESDVGEEDDVGEPARPVDWLRFEEGVRQVGHEPGGFSFDNEGPRHRCYLGEFEIASRPVTNGEFLEFIADDGYRRPELWLSDGWSTVEREGWERPVYWEQRDGAWLDFTLLGVRELRLAEPVCHVSYYEMDAYARWSGERLPTEAEWEVAAVAHAEARGSFAESGRLQPAPSRGASFLGDVWEWTQSPYVPYPGYRAPRGAVGEYNGKFMANQVVLRGGSCATPESHIRPSYRNFFYPDARWQFSGARLARDL
ncbi:MAG: ergothioneine biosynthesis protein EgtB [Deltaproteobacteria bacterium]|nr:ergothioneine biosynthesis protein EgtB [Deltaproteobacteria bacterium]